MNYILALLPWNWQKMRASSEKVLWLLKSFRWCVFMALKLLDYTSRHCCRNLSENFTARLYNHRIGMRSYILKSNFKFNLQKHHFAYVYEVIIKCYLNFITCLYFPLALITWNSSPCHQMELFKSKESCKKLSFVGKHLSFYPKDVCSFSVFFI